MGELFEHKYLSVSFDAAKDDLYRFMGSESGVNLRGGFMPAHTLLGDVKRKF